MSWDKYPSIVQRAGAELDHPSALRNREPIAQVLERVLPEAGHVLEIASGTGTHALYYAQRMPWLRWQPSEVDPRLVAIMQKRIADCERDNLQPPMRIDVTADWPVEAVDAIVCSNMLHISPWSCAEGLFCGAGRVLREPGVMFVYGPFLVDGKPTAVSNARFDESLRSRDPSWGIRWLHDIDALAGTAGLQLDEVIDMPANNLSLVFRR